MLIHVLIQYDGINRISDENSFLFSFYSNGRLDQPTKFEINDESKDWAFQLWSNDSENLFIFGGGNDIKIRKQEYKEKCTCEQYSFDYNNNYEVLIGKEGKENPFTVKRILCWQMNESEQQKKKRIENQRIKISNENKELIDSTVEIEIEWSDEIKQIERWSDTTFDEVIFDSNCCDWKQKTSTFNKHIRNRDNCAFIVEDTENNVFGAFITKKLDLTKLEQNDDFVSHTIGDKDAFVFSLRSNGRLPNPTKFDIIPCHIEYAINIYQENYWLLFEIGDTDIVVAKEEANDENFNVPKSFDYQKHQKVLNRKEGSNERYSTKRIQVWHFTLSEEQKQQREELKIKQEQLRINTFNEEKRQLNILSSSIMKEFKNEIEQIEEWSELSMKTVLFDSQFCDWTLRTSTFAEHILHKEKLAFLILTETNILFGGFIYAKAQTYHYNEETKQKDGTVDPNSFVFTFKDNDPMKFELKKDVKKESTFFICTNENIPELFAFGPCGYHDIWVGKKGVNPFCCQNPQKSYYNFRSNKNALVGISGLKYLENQFEIKRFVVIQFQ